MEFYRNYIAIVEQGTLTAASKELHIAQSALSSQLKKFEDEYGTPLFIRSARHMEPTTAGRILYDKAKNMVALEDAAHREVQACKEGNLGTVRLAMTQAYPDAEMEKLLTSFRLENPNIRFEFYEYSSYEIIELLRAGVAEIGIVRTSGVLPPDIQEKIRIQQKLYVYCRYQNPWLSPIAEQVPLSALDQRPLAISRGFVDVLKDVFQRADVHPQIMSISTSRSKAVMWTKAGEAMAIVCLGNVEPADNAEYFYRPLYDSDELVRKMLNPIRFFAVKKDRVLSAAARKFLAYCETFYGVKKTD